MLVNIVLETQLNQDLGSPCGFCSAPVGSQDSFRGSLFSCSALGSKSGAGRHVTGWGEGWTGDCLNSCLHSVYRGAGCPGHPGFIYLKTTVKPGSHSQARVFSFLRWVRTAPLPWACPFRDGADCLSSPGWSACNFKIYWSQGDSQPQMGNKGNYKRPLG